MGAAMLLYRVGLHHRPGLAPPLPAPLVQYRPACGAWEPKDLPANLTTHAVYAFCFLNPGR